jgi:hypothetical protein
MNWELQQVMSIWLFSFVKLPSLYSWKLIAICSLGPSLFSLVALWIWRFDLDLPQASHCIVVMPLIFTPLDYCTRCLIAAGPGCPSLLCYIIAVALCSDLLLRFICTWKAEIVVTSCLMTYCPYISVKVAMRDPSCWRRVVGSPQLSYYMP